MGDKRPRARRPPAGGARGRGQRPSPLVPARSRRRRAAEPPRGWGAPGSRPRRPRPRSRPGPTEARAADRHRPRSYHAGPGDGSSRNPPLWPPEPAGEVAGRVSRSLSQRACTGARVAVWIHPCRERGHGWEERRVRARVSAGRPACGVHGCEHTGVSAQCECLV